MGATVLIGLIASKKKEEKKQSNDDFLMAGKSLGPVVLAGTLFAANTGGASTTGIATNVFKYGLSASWYVIAGGIGFILVSFIAPYFRRAQANTVPEIISKRYGKNKSNDYRENRDGYNSNNDLFGGAYKGKITKNVVACWWWKNRQADTFGS